MLAVALRGEDSTYGLDNSTAIDLAGQLEDFASHDVEEGSLLALIATFKEFLNDIVAVHIFHELNGVRHDLTEDTVFLITSRSFELVLNEL